MTTTIVDPRALTADGFSLDDNKHTPLLEESKLGCAPSEPLAPAELDRNNLPDVLTRWKERNGSERDRARTDQSFCVPKADIVAEGYDLSIRLEVSDDLVRGWRMLGVVSYREGMIDESKIAERPSAA